MPLQKMTSIQINLVMYTKEYCIKQLLGAIRSPMIQYFKFQNAVAEQDAKRDSRTGKMKHLVKFQQRLAKIPTMTEIKINRILTSFKKDNDFPLESLIKTILLANSIIIGSFGQKNIDSYPIDIPTATSFFHQLLKNVGRVYFAEPVEALGSNQYAHNIVEDGLNRTIEQLLPFENLIKPIKEQGEFKSMAHDPSAPQFARDFIEKASSYDTETVERLAQEEAWGREEPAEPAEPPESGSASPTPDVEDPGSDEYGFD